MLERTLPLVVLSSMVAGCGANVELGKTPIVVSVPDGFVVDTHVHTTHPSLHFSLALGADGTGPLFPQLSIEQVNTEFHPARAHEYVNAKRRGANGHFVLEPTNTKVEKQPAVEMAISTSAVADLVTSTGMTGKRFELVAHEIVFSHGEHYYVCKLASYPDEYETYVDAVRSLCKSVKLASVN